MRDLSLPVNDLEYILNMPSIKRIAYFGFKDTNLSSVIEDFKSLARWRKIYDQIRILDASGNEIVRINYNNGVPKQTLPSELQNKQNRYYVKEALKLQKGEIYISPIDYNVEQGVVEKPYKPVIRFATPLYDNSGVIKGLVILNYYADTILQSFDKAALYSFGSIYLLDSDLSTILVIESETDSMGKKRKIYLNPEQNKRLFFKTVNKKLLTNECGQFLRNGNIITFTSITGLDNFIPKEYYKFQMSSSGRWKLVSFIESRIISNRLKDFRVKLILVSTLIALLAVIIIIFTIGLRIKNSETDRLLSESKIQFKQLVKTMNEGVIISNLKGQIVFVNKRFCEITGYDNGELVGKYFTHLTPVLGRKRLLYNLRRLIEDNMKKPLEIEIERKDGEKILLAITPSKVKDESGTPSGFMALIRDITRDKILEERLNEESQFFQANPSVLLRTDSSGMVTFRNTIAVSFFNKDPLGESIDVITGMNILVDIKKLLSGKSLQFEIEKSGITIMFTVIKNVNGDSIYFYGSDITKLKEARIERLNLLQAVEQSESTIVITDINQKIIYANKSLERITGYSLKEVIGKTPAIFRSGLTPENKYRELKDRISSGKSWKGVFVNRKKDGTLYWEHAVITPVVDDKGKIINYVAVKDDITQQKEMERELKIAKEKAEKANKLKSEFLANMSHEVRTPMNAIIGYTDILLEKEDDVEKRNELLIIKRSGNTLLNLINDILDFSKIEAGKMEITMKPFYIIKVLENIASMFRQKIKEKGLKFVMKIDKSVPDQIYGDEMRLSQIIINFLSNALKFTDKGYIKLSARYRLKDKKLIISVKDTGIGIKKDHQKVVFSPFRQIIETEKQLSGGTGLGLSISLKLAKLMKGGISLRSIYGKGSTFILKIPAEIAISETSNSDETNNINKDLSEEVIGKPSMGEYEYNTMVDRWIDNFKDEKEMVDILLMGIRKLPLKLEKLEDAVLKNDKDGIRYISHELKGMSGNLKMNEVFDIISSINEEVNKDDWNISVIRNFVFELKDIINNIPAEYFNEKRKLPEFPVFDVDFNILLAEDNSVNQELMKAIFNTIHLSCDIAGDGEEALKKIREKNYDLILLDIQMPKLNGKEVLYEIRKDKKLKDIYVVALTAHAIKGDAKKYRDMGFDDYISKPINIENFKEKIYMQLIKKKEKRFTSDTNQDFTREEKKKIREAIGMLEKNKSLFNPKVLENIANELKSITNNRSVKNIADKLLSAARTFDDTAVPKIVKELNLFIDALKKY